MKKGFGSKWRKAKVKLDIGRALTHAGDLGKAKRLGVELREQLQRGAPVDLAHLARDGGGGDSDAHAAVLQKDYYGDHALTYLCQNEAVSAAMVHALLQVPGSAALARDRSKVGRRPHRLKPVLSSVLSRCTF